MSTGIGSLLDTTTPEEDYKSALARCTVPTVCRQSYVRASKLIEWWGSDTLVHGKTTSQATRFLEHTYSEWEGHKHSNSMTKDKLLGVSSSPSILIFSILLEIGWGSLIHLFPLRGKGQVDSELPFGESALKRHLKWMASTRDRWREIPDPNTVAEMFFQAQWKFCPYMFKGEFNILKAYHIIPIHKQDLISNKGGTAELYEIEVLSECVGGRLKEDAKDLEYTPTDDPENYGSRYHLALKIYNTHRGEDTCINERNAFEALQGHDGIVRYLGGYGQETSLQSSRDTIINAEPIVHHIILEFGKCDLDTILCSYIPPILQDEIEAFWEKLFKLVEAVNHIHNLTITRDRLQSYYNGWHADIKPANILEIGGIFKLADPGFAKFKENNKGKGHIDPKTNMRGGTRSFGAPELHARWSSSGGAYQTIDIWSLGCVFSVAATWVALGHEGIKQYDILRSQAIRKRVDDQKLSPDGTGPKLEYGDYFHDGINVLPEVGDWHKYLRVVLRKTDTSTCDFLDLVDKYMLVGSPTLRSKSSELSEKLTATRLNPRSPQTLVPASILAFLKNLDEEIFYDLDTAPISYEAPPSRSTHFSYQDRQDQKEKYRNAPLAPTTSRSQRMPKQPIPKPSESLRISTIKEERSTSSQSSSESASLLEKYQDTVPEDDFTSVRRTPTRRTPTLRQSTFSIRKQPMLTIRAAREAMDEKRKGFFSRLKPSKKDAFLDRHYTNRDIKFLVDNSGSMAEYWENTKYALETLLMKISGIDEDGIDLSFTQGNESIKNEKNIAKIMDRMNRRGAIPIDGLTTNILDSLVGIFEDYKLDIEQRTRSYRKTKKMTILVLTDAMWNNTAEEVGRAITLFVKSLKGIFQGYMKGQFPFSIEFIQFGRDPEATLILEHLDNNLEREGIPDIVDYEHWTGDINKMLLGSFKKEFDDLQEDSSTLSSSSSVELQESPGSMMPVLEASSSRASSHAPGPYFSTSPQQDQGSFGPPLPSVPRDRRRHNSYARDEEGKESRDPRKSNSVRHRKRT